ncbi:class F sortase [Marisediminicola senii]|uniref:class F sortase n=1 Tax=Marisediminicola senii TaxID=2711233 RepID=UPI0013E9F54A|nr:class F sortase [Marisediminicola senii]
MSATDKPRPRRRLLIGGAAIALVAAIGVGVAVDAASSGSPDGAASAATEPVAAAPATGAADGVQNPVDRVAEPSRDGVTASRVSIPAIGVDSTLEQLGLDPTTRELTPPVEWMSAGWYRDGTLPGEVGPAVIAGHVDSVTAPAVFARLNELVAGDEVIVTLSDGSTETFVVDSMTSAPKNEFPTEAVYGPTPTEQLRLITCDGAFDSATGHYVDNLVVFASLAA